MRVIAGSARRMTLKTPKGDDTRPTQDRIKETLFNIIQNEVPGSVFVDLFAGSGGIGIEALSRGAKRAYFVENGSIPAACIAENLNHTHLADKAVILRQDVVQALRNIREKEVDIVYIDPPYGDDQYLRTLIQLGSMGYISERTMIIVECPAGADIDIEGETDFTVVREKNYKSNMHLFLGRKEGPD